MDGGSFALFTFALFLAVRTLLDLMREHERAFRISRRIAQDRARVAERAAVT